MLDHLDSTYKELLDFQVVVLNPSVRFIIDSTVNISTVESY